MVNTRATICSSEFVIILIKTKFIILLLWLLSLSSIVLFKKDGRTFEWMLLFSFINKKHY